MLVYSKAHLSSSTASTTVITNAERLSTPMRLKGNSELQQLSMSFQKAIKSRHSSIASQKLTCRRGGGCKRVSGRTTNLHSTVSTKISAGDPKAAKKTVIGMTVKSYWVLRDHGNCSWVGLGWTAAGQACHPQACGLGRNFASRGG